jgi:AcrR family transcriptional regulator
MPSTDDQPRAGGEGLRGRPGRRLSRADREEQVLCVAREQFARRGFAAVTMEDIALEVGVKKPLLYAYFGNKERLYEACMAPAGEALIAAVAAAVDRASTPAEALRLGAGAFFDFVDRDRDAWRVLFDETVPASGEIAAVVAPYRERLLEMIALATVALMPPHRRTGSRATIEATSIMVMAATEALARWWLRTGAMPAADAANLLIATLEPGLMADRAERIDRIDRTERPSTRTGRHAR